MRRGFPFVMCLIIGMCAMQVLADPGVVPLGPDGNPLNLDFETGTLKDWKADGDAFAGQPVKGDNVAKRRRNHSQHAGEYWIGTYEVAGDGPTGELISAPFKVTHPWASFLVGGGRQDDSVNIVLADDNRSIASASGHNAEEMERVAVDLHEYVGKQIYIRIIDDSSKSWGHINFDDFRFHNDPPDAAKRTELTADVTANAGLSPAEAVKAIAMSAGFGATLFAGEPDINQPIGFCIDDRGRLWVAEAYTYPVRAPEGQGKDRILIFEDTDGDGKFDKRTVFTDGLNLVSGIEVGFGGVWVGAAPYFMFIPDKDHDDKPDGPPQVLLDGWAYQDTHETLNAFTWGPDGWLYGCHGVFTHSLVGKPGTPKEQRVPLNAAVWRYHPTRHEFEVFAEGTSNPWGIDFNDRGQAFITACVIPHLYHVIEGAHYLRQAGNHFNPYVYQDINTIADHVHWLGDMGPHAGNNKSAAAGGGHAHCGAMIYLADSWPAEYRDTLFMANIHGNRFNNDRLVPSGSGYVGTHAPDPILMNDRWSRLINLKYGPDGSVYAIDWYDKQACHMQNPEIWDRTNGRIYKFVYKDQPAVKVDLASKSDEELADLMLSKNDWYVRHARRLLQERASITAGQSEAPPRVSASTQKLTAQKLTALLSNEDVTRRLRGLWALHCTGALTAELTNKALKDSDPYMRGWAIQLAAEHFGPMNLTNFSAPRPESSPQAAEYLSSLAEMAKTDASPIVRLYLAGACQRIPVAQRGLIVEALLAHAEDAGDHNLPLMYWYAAEPIVGADISRGVELARKCAIPLVRELIARRICAEATKVAAGEIEKVNPAPLAAVARLLDETNDPAAQRDILAGMQAGLTGWQKLPMPDAWPQVAQKLSASGSTEVRSISQAISVVFGEAHAMAALQSVIPDTQQPAQVRRDAIASLVGAKDRALPPILQSLLSDSVVCSSALRGLAAFDDPNTPAAIVKAYPSMAAENRLEALNTLASRVEYARQFKAAMEAGVIARADVSAATLRQLGTLESEDIKSWVSSTFGQVRKSPAEKQQQIQSLIKTIGPRIDRADVSNGRALFAKTCMQCHTLFDTGGKVGPDLTGSNRADLNYVLSNIVDPSAVIAKEYMVSIIRLKDKRVISGIVKGDDGNALSVRTESELLTIPKSDVVRQTQQNISMMPEGLLAAMQPDEIRDLLGYLRSSKQVLMLATKYNAASFFNGKDLTNWSGDPKLWSVQNGEIVGKTDGLKKNQFLFSDMLEGDFKLTLKVKLIANTGNSGVQFRSEPLPDGEARGYQADIGPGWWGKLYEENGRALIVKEGGEQWINPNDWNDYEITAIGSKIHTTLNGHPCVNIDDPEGPKRGRIAFQLHAGEATEVRFKEITLEVK